MPPSIPSAKHHPGQPATVFESTSTKWARLSPWAQQSCWSAPDTSWSSWGWNWSSRYRHYTRQSWPDEAWTDNHVSEHHRSAVPTSWAEDRPSTAARPRADAPCVRNLFRGTTNDALAALRSLGIDQIIESLDNDRYAASSASSHRSHVRTWSLFHAEVFSQVDPVPPVIPIAVRSLIGVASLFKAGGIDHTPTTSKRPRTSTARPATIGPSCLITRLAGSPDLCSAA